VAVKRLKRTRQLEADTERSIPVTIKAQACRQADATWLPQTIFRVVERDGCGYFHVSNCYWRESSVAQTIIAEGGGVAPMQTYLPSRYFVR